MSDIDSETPNDEPIETPRWPEDEPFAQSMPGESTAWLSRLASYCMQGPSRSVRSVYKAERGHKESKSVPGSWHKASQEFQWRRRAAEYDAWQRKALFTIGNAADTERVRKLNIIAGRMYKRLLERVDAMEVNDRFVGQLLAVFDLMAKHTGGYGPQRIEHTGKDGKAIEVEETKLNVVWYMPEVAPLDDGAQGDGAAIEDVQGADGAGPVLDDENAGGL
jgi:hypothetical protein